MKKMDAKAVREKMGLTGVIIVGFDSKNDGFSFAVEGDVSLGIAATELLSVFYANLLRKKKDVSADELSSVGAFICTKALSDAMEAVENE